MQTATATPAKPITKRTRKTTGNPSRRTAATGAAIDAGNLARLQEDEELAARAGLSLPPPVYTLGTEVNEIGRKNFLTKRAAWDARPGFGAVCTEAIERIRAERRANVEVQLSDLFMRSNGALVHAPIGTSTDAPAAEWQLTKTGLMGLMGPISGANGGARYLLDAPADLRAMNLNYWISTLIKDEKAREKVWSLRTRECMDWRQAGQREVFAATSTSYPVLDADTLAEVAAAAVPAGAKGELVYDGTRFRLGASWFSDIQPAQVCAGEVFRAFVFLDTRDDGLGSIRVRYGVERNLCLNLIILGRAETKLSVRHAGNAGELRAAVEAAFAESARAMQGFATRWSAAREEEVLGEAQWNKYGTEAIFRRLVDADLVRAPGVKPDELVPRLVTAWQAEPGYTRADLVNAITRAAHTETWASPWVTETLEEQAGELLHQRVYWNQVLDTAAAA